jgi:2-methylcitrate dehydratase PrpD
MNGLALQLAEWTSGVRAASIPVNVTEAAVRAFIDTTGVLLAGATDDIAPVMRNWVAERPRADGAGVPPFGLRTDLETAALALGTLAHALDFDDIHPAMLGHPSAVLVSVILSLGPAVQARGEQALAAYVVGGELAAHLGRATAPLQYNRGWHTTSTIGVLAAAAAGARLLKLDPPTTAHALGLAASAAAGLRANFGSHAKPLHAGQAAAHGVTAALLARAGLRAAPDALDGPRGYLENFTGDRSAGAPVVASLGTRWELADPGLQVKLYACCGGAHRPIDALLDVIQKDRLAAHDVKEVVAFVDPLVPTLLVYPEPTTVAEARFSLQYCFAAALADGKLSPSHFTPASLGRADLREIGGRIRMQLHPELVTHKGELAFAEVRVLTRSGTCFTHRVDYPKGSGQRPLTQIELEQKFFECARMYVPAHDWSVALRAILDLRTGGSVAAVEKALTVMG